MNKDLFGNPYRVPKAMIIKGNTLNGTATKTKGTEHEISTITEIATIDTIANFKNSSITQVNVYRRNGSAPMNPNAKKNLNNQGDNENNYNGYLSPATKREIQKMLTVWLTGIEINTTLKNAPKVVDADAIFPTFVTLTLPSPQVHRDNVIKEICLVPFIEWLKDSSEDVTKRGVNKGKKRGFGVQVYFWRAEAQPETTNIHFHLIIDKYVPWDRIRAKWNQCVNRLGYVDRFALMEKRRFRNGFKINENKLQSDLKIVKGWFVMATKTKEIPHNASPLFKRYMEASWLGNLTVTSEMLKVIAQDRQKNVYESNLACGFTNPNSTDIEAVHNLDCLAEYLTKYVSKSPTEIPIKPNQKVAIDPILGKECIYTYKESVNKYTGEVEKEEIDMQYYKPKFLERTIGGRLWGCSDTLRGFKLKEDDEVYTDEIGRTFKVEYLETETNNAIEVKTPVHTMKYFTKTLETRMVLVSTSGKEAKVFVSPPEPISLEAIEYVQKLTDIAGKENIERISKKVGVSFEKMMGKIIPMMPEKMGYCKARETDKRPYITQRQIMKDHAPELYKEYIAYFNHIFTCMYPNIKATT